MANPNLPYTYTQIKQMLDNEDDQDSKIAALEGKKFKTINGLSIEGEGNIAVEGAGGQSIASNVSYDDTNSRFKGANVQVILDYADKALNGYKTLTQLAVKDRTAASEWGNNCLNQKLVPKYASAVGGQVTINGGLRGATYCGFAIELKKGDSVSFHTLDGYTFNQFQYQFCDEYMVATSVAVTDLTSPKTITAEADCLLVGHMNDVFGVKYAAKTEEVDGLSLDRTLISQLNERVGYNRYLQTSETDTLVGAINENKHRQDEFRHSPLYGSNIVWFADSLLQSTANMVDGVRVGQTYATLPTADKDERARSMDISISGTNYYGYGHNGDGVNFDYWISKRTHCNSINKGLGGFSIFGMSEEFEVSNNHLNMLYKSAGKTYVNKFQADYSNIPYDSIAKQGDTDLKTYVHITGADYNPDYIILSYGTNDNVYITNNVTELASLPTDGSAYLNKVVRYVGANGTYTFGKTYSWKDDGTGTGGVMNYSWVEVSAKSIGSIDTMQGADGTFDCNTLYGCYGKVITYYKMTYPSAKLGIILDGSTSMAQRNAFLNICKYFRIGFLDLQTIKYPLLCYNFIGQNVNNPIAFSTTTDYARDSLVGYNNKVYRALTDVVKGEWDASKWVVEESNKMTALSPTPIGKAKGVYKSKSGQHSGNYSYNEDVYSWCDMTAMELYYAEDSADMVHPTLENAKRKSIVVENWLLTL